MPDGRDPHVYGGGLIAAIGFSLVFVPAALFAFGALFVFLGLRA